MKLLLCLTALLLSAAAECPFTASVGAVSARDIFRNTYTNEAYRYSVRVPAHLKGRHESLPPHHGFAIDLGVRNGKRDAYIFVDGSHNSLELKTPAEQVAKETGYLEEDGVIESKTSQPTTVDSLPAMTLTATFRCQGSSQRYVVISTYVLSKSGDLAYTLALYAPEELIGKYKPTHEAMVRSWKLWPTWRK